MKNKIKIILIPLFIVIIGFGIFKYIQYRNSSVNKLIFVSGTIEATEVHLGFQVGGKIKEMLKSEGASVKAGEIMARLDKEELFQLKKQAETSLQESKFNSERLKIDYDRMEKLFQSGSVSAQERDKLKTDFDMATTRLATLQAVLDLAMLRLNYTDLVSPIDGIVTVKSAEIGEIVQVGSTIFTVSDLKNIWVTAYIKETELGIAKINQEAKIKIDTYPNKEYTGYVSFISPESEFTPKNIQTKEERVNLVYRIKISVDNNNLELKTGMPVDAYLVTE
jgi:HlyD family secretion protein